MEVKQGSVIALAIFMVSAVSVAVAYSDKPKSDKQLIKSAMSAAPRAVSKHAAVYMPDAKGAMRMLRAGTNGWTCIPANPNTPGEDPMCLDPNALEWMLAYMHHQTPPDKVGFGYMLKGGWDTSNVDPYAAPPTKKGDWIRTGPHIMIFGPAVKDMSGYETGAHPDTELPYIMWHGTPYEHLMIPVED